MTDETRGTPSKARQRKPRPKGMGGVYERRGTWYLRFTWRGRDHRESSGSARKGDAVDLLKDRIKEMRDGTFQPGGAKVTLANLRDIMIADCERNGRKYVPRVKQCFANLERIIGADTRVRDIDAARLDSSTCRRGSRSPSGKPSKERSRNGPPPGPSTASWDP